MACPFCLSNMIVKIANSNWLHCQGCGEDFHPVDNWVDDCPDDDDFDDDEDNDEEYYTGTEKPEPLCPHCCLGSVYLNDELEKYVCIFCNEVIED